MGLGYTHSSLDESETNPDKPGRRWELSPQVGVDRFNYNVAVLRAGERLSQNAYHYHERQAEFFHVVENACRVEVDDGSFDLPADHVVHFEAGVNHLLHNPFEADCRLIAVGAPPEGRYPVHQVQSYEDLVEARYPNGDLSKPSEVV